MRELKNLELVDIRFKIACRGPTPASSRPIGAGLRRDRTSSSFFLRFDPFKLLFEA